MPFTGIGGKNVEKTWDDLLQDMGYARRRARRFWRGRRPSRSAGASCATGAVRRRDSPPSWAQRRGRRIWRRPWSAPCGRPPETITAPLRAGSDSGRPPVRPGSGPAVFSVPLYSPGRGRGGMGREQRGASSCRGTGGPADYGGTAGGRRQL